MKKFFPLVFMLLSVVCQGQITSNILVLSRKDAIKIGLQNRFDIKANQFDLKIAASKISQAKSQWLPEISGDGNVKYSPQLQKTIIPGGLLPGINQIQLIPLSARNESVFGLNLSQQVFNSGLSNDTKLAKNQLALQQEKNRQAEVDIVMQISQAYLDVQLRELQMKVAIDIAARNTAYAKIAEGMYKSGSLIENHYLQANLDRNNALQLQKQAAQSYHLSLMKLQYQLNLPNETQLRTSDSLDTVNDTLTVAKTQAMERTEISQLQLRQQADKLYLKKIQQSVLPSVSLGANYSQQFASKNLKYGDGRWWSPFSYFTLNVHIPISAYYKNKSVTREYNQRIMQDVLLLNQKQADINFEIDEAETSYSNALSNIKNARNSYELSKVIFHNQQAQFRLGAFDYTALLDTEKSLSTTEQNYIQSAYELLLAQIKLQKATNNFNLN